LACGGRELGFAREVDFDREGDFELEANGERKEERRRRAAREESIADTSDGGGLEVLGYPCIPGGGSSDRELPACGVVEVEASIRV
jgi:hypothetical protein